MEQVRFNAPGNDFDVIRPITLIPAGDSMAKAWLTVKANASDADLAALVQLSITTASTASGQITDSGSGDTAGSVTFKLTPAQTRLIGTIPRYYDIKVKSTLGKVYTADSGDIAAKAEEITVVDV